MRKFRIYAYCSPPVSKENYVDYKECGFNTVLIDHSYARIGTKEYNKIYDICDELGLDAIPMSFYDGATQKFPIDGDPVDYNKFKSFKGVFLWDEPLKKDWPVLKERIKYFNEKYPGKEIWVNTTPCYAEMELANKYPNTADGKAHARVDATMRLWGEEIIDSIKGKKVFSMDYYPLELRDGKMTVLHDYLWGVEVCSEVAKEKKYDFHMYIQTAGWAHGEAPAVAPKTAEEIRFQCLIALAYGAVGFAYFTYITPLCTGYYGAIIEYGKKTCLYDAAKTVNAELMKIEPVIEKFEYNGSALWIGEKPEKFARTALFRMKYLYTNYKKLRLVDNLYDVIIGEFQKGDEYCYVITNYINPLSNKTNVLKLEIYGDVEKVNIYRKGKKTVQHVFHNELDIEIDAGDGIVLTF